MAALKYIIELIIIFYIVRMGLRFLDGLFGTKVNADTVNQSNHNQTNTNNWQGKHTPKQNPIPDSDYIDYEELK